MRAVAIIQARLRSNRLPGKVLAELGGQTMIARVVERARRMATIDEVVLAVPLEDLPAFALLFPSVRVYGGPTEDVLRRYRLAASWAHASLVVRITGDCPFVDAEEADRVLSCLRDTGDVDYASNVYPERTVPDGFDVEAFTWEALLFADAYERDPVGWTREHVTGWMRQNLRCRSVPGRLARDWSGLKLSVDDGTDYIRARDVIAKAPPDASMVDLIRVALGVP